MGIAARLATAKTVAGIVLHDKTTVFLLLLVSKHARSFGNEKRQEHLERREEALWAFHTPISCFIV
jgi:hypothetical protein